MNFIVPILWCKRRDAKYKNSFKFHTFPFLKHIAKSKLIKVREHDGSSVLQEVYGSKSQHEISAISGSSLVPR